MERLAYDVLCEALAELNWPAEAESLKKMTEANEQGLYFVAFIGQYSAGKSYLINNLLNRDLLPRGILETTPLLTYIRYGETVGAWLHYQDGTVEAIGLDMVKGIDQQQLRDPDQLEHLEICLPEEMLKNGMVLLDTPGINTLIERHEELLASSLGLASKVIFVTKGAPSALDVEKMTDIRSLGIDVAYVRTHCDEIRASEENEQDAVKSDQAILQEKCEIDASNCWHVSNLKQSPWYSRIEDLRIQLEELGEDAHLELDNAMRIQMASLASRCIEPLSERASALEAAVKQDSTALQEKKHLCEERIEKLQAFIEQKGRDYEHRTADLRKKLQTTIDEEVDKQLEKADSHIQRSDIQPNDARGIQAMYENERRAVVREIRTILDDTMDPILQEVNGELDLAGVSLVQLPALPESSYTELAARQDMESERLLDQLKSLQAERQNLEQNLAAIQNDPAYQELPALLESAQAQIAQAIRVYRELPPYEPKMIPVYSDELQPSQVASIIGSVLDWATLLIPGTAYGKGVKLLLAGKDGAKLPALARTLGKIEKTSKLISNGLKAGDSIKDTSYALRNMSKTYATAKRVAKAEQVVEATATGVAKAVTGFGKAKQAEGGPLAFLDYLTFQFWAEKIGKSFDSPPKYKEDETHAAADRELRRQCREAIRASQEKEFQYKEKMRIYRNEQERLEAERKSRQVNEERLKQEIAKKRTQFQRDFMLQAAQEWRRQCGEAFKRQMRAGIDQMIAAYIQDLPDRLEAYRHEMLSSWETKLLEERKIYDTLLNQQPDHAEEMLRTLKPLLEELKTIADGACKTND